LFFFGFVLLCHHEKPQFFNFPQRHKLLQPLLGSFPSWLLYLHAKGLHAFQPFLFEENIVDLSVAIFQITSLSQSFL